MAKSKKVMQVEHLGESMWLYDNGDIRNSKGHLKGKGELPQSYIDGKKALEEKSKPYTEIREELEARTPDYVSVDDVSPEPEDLPEPPPPPQEIKDPPMNDLQVVLNIGTQTADGFEVSFTKSKIIGSHNIKVISGQLRHKLSAALERIVLQSNADLRAIRDAPMVEQFKKWAEEDAKKAEQKKELKNLLKGL